jgi:aspartate/methionine/tyrosine aminotransferase
MTPEPNPLLVDTGTPPIPQARQWLVEYDGSAGPAVNMSQAAPGTPPPAAMLERLAAAAADPSTTGYGSIFGERPLIDTYAHHVSHLYRTTIAPEEIAITTGCNQAFFIALMAVARSGDAVMLPEPWYFNHQMTLQMLGIKVVPLPCTPESGFVPNIDTARRLMRPDVRAIVLVTPNNPTGAIYPASTIAAFAHLANERNAWLILDETYRDFLADAEACPHAIFSNSDQAARTIQLYSFSKSYAIPGHRIGAVKAPRALMPEIGKVLDCLQICPPRVGQTALTWAIPALAEWRETNRAVINDRALAFNAALASSGWSISSIGAYFAYVCHPYRGVSSAVIARRLATEAGVLALPGTYFGTDAQNDHIRFAFANADKTTIADLGERLARLGPA